VTRRPRSQAAALARALLARFFENEITRGADDLKSSFFWMAGVLAAPGIFIPLLMSFEWSVVGMTRGAEVLQVMARGDKAFYLGLAMAVSAIVSGVSWNSLMPDRREGLILGALPLHASTVIAAKLLALGAYVGLVGLAMHTAGALLFGFALASDGSFVFLLRGIAGHLVASFAATAFVLLSVTGLLGLMLGVTGPRVFARVAPLLQALLATAVIAGFWALPTINTTTVSTLAGGGTAQPWILLTPPLWFLGIYEAVIGTDDSRILDLARTGGLAFAASLLTTAVTYPLAYRRVMASAVEGLPARGSRRRLPLSDRFVRGLGADPRLRAVGQFYLATLAKSDRHRFVLAVGLGLATAWSLPVLLALAEPPRHPSVALLSQPVAAMLFLLTALRLGAALPADIGAGWIFQAQRPGRLEGHRALERIMFVLGVVPVTLVFVPLHGWLLGAWAAVAHGALVLALGVLLIELMLWGFDGAAAVRPWDIESARLGRLWPAYLGAFLVCTLVTATLSMRLVHRPIAMLGLVAAVALLGVLTRYVSLRQPLDAEAAPDAAPGELLGLN
jgi:hypothetical protein